MYNYLMSDSVDLFSHVGSNSTAETRTYDGIEIETLDDGHRKFSYGDFMYQGAGNEIERLDEKTAEIAMNWLDTVDDDSPVFMYFNFQASHSPFNALPEDYQRVFFKEKDEMAERVLQGKTAGVPLSYVVNAYKDSLHYVDQNIGDLVSHMKATGRHDNTIYIVSADTSIRFTTDILGNGGDLLPDVLNIPVVISMPGMNTQEVVSTPVEQIDIMPTVFGMLGLNQHPASQGRDVLSHPDAERIVYAVAQTPASHQYSAIYKDWQLVHDYSTNKMTMSYLGAKQLADENQLPAEKVDWLVKQLGIWRNSQVAYYSDAAINSSYNPPRYWDTRWISGEKSLPILTEVTVD